MLIDQFMPEWQYLSHHDVLIEAPPGVVYSKVKVLDLSDSLIIRWLFRLRGLPASALTLAGLRELNFSLLREVPAQELLLGVAGRFWALRGDLQNLAPEDFQKFSRPGYAKAVWNFFLRPEDGGTRLSTETRIQCLDSATLRSFRRYWAVIGPFSSWIRREALRTLKKQAEGQADRP